MSDNTCQTASRGLVGSLKPVFTRGEALATVYSLMGLAVGLRGIRIAVVRVRHDRSAPSSPSGITVGRHRPSPAVCHWILI